MNTNAPVSFFDEPVEDESITLNEDELNNILEEGKTDLGAEPDVIIIEKERVLPTLDLSGGSDEVAAASELMGPEQTVYVEPGFEDEASSGLTDATEISEITAFNDAEPASSPVGGESDVSEVTPESAQGLDDLSLEESATSEAPGVETVGFERTTRQETPEITETILSVDESPVESVSVDEEISLSGDELENIVASSAEPVVEAAAPVEPVMEISANTLPVESVSEAAIPVEGVVFTDEPQSVDAPVEVEETASLSDIPESTSAEEIEFERLDADQIPVAVETEPVALTEVEPIELEILEAVPESTETLSSGTEVLAEPMEETSNAVETSVEQDLAVSSAGITPLEPEPETALPALEGIEEIDLDETPAAETTVIQKQAPAKTDNLKLYADEPAQGSFFSEGDDDEAITLSSDELNNILDNADVEQSGEMVSADEAVPSAAAPAAALTGPLSRDNLKEIFVYLDNLLDKLPDTEVRRFAESRYYDLYNQIFDELDIV